MEITTKTVGNYYAYHKFDTGKKSQDTVTFSLGVGEESNAKSNVSDKADTTSATAKELYQQYTDGETTKVVNRFRKCLEERIAEHTLNSNNIKKEDDWREMDNDEWDKLLEHIDKYIDAFKEELEQMEEEQKKAVMEAVASAPADRRAVAISDALQNVIAKGSAEAGSGENASSLEKLSWTHEMKTDDQVILATAKMANKRAADFVSKAQEMTQTNDRISGASETVDDKKYADREDAEEGKQM